jgi:hypothetical protein
VLEPLARAGSLLGGVEMILPEAAHGAKGMEELMRSLPAPSPLFSLAQDTPIWENVVRYAQYFLSVMLGTGYVMLKPFGQLLKNPLTGLLLVGFTVAFVYFVKVTVAAMLGVQDLFEYEPSSAVTNQL